MPKPQGSIGFSTVQPIECCIVDAESHASVRTVSNVMCEGSRAGHLLAQSLPITSALRTELTAKAGTNQTPRRPSVFPTNFQQKCKKYTQKCVYSPPNNCFSILNYLIHCDTFFNATILCRCFGTARLRAHIKKNVGEIYKFRVQRF